MAWNEGLEGESLSIAGANDRRIRVMAGPGSGKTYTLMRRIARLLEEGVNPERILLLTFTRTAAIDLIKSLSELKVQGAEKIRAGTLHSYCFSVLNQESVLRLTNRTPRPLLKFETDFLLEDLSHLRKRGKTETEKKLNAFEAAWARLQNHEPGFAIDPEDHQFQIDIIDYLKFECGMLIGELIPVTLEYLRNNPQCPELTAYDYVFVDEYQDLNKAEQNLINRLSESGNLMIIGDEDQSIYQGFRHANPEGIRLFHESHPDTIDYSLNVCRRCPKTIVQIANSFIQLNQNREPRQLNPKPDNPDGHIKSIQWPTIRDEASGIGKYIKNKIQNGTSPGEILVLCPRRQFGYAIKEVLLELNVPAHSFFQEEMLDDDDAKEAYTLLNLLVNSNDNVAWRYIIGKGENPNCAGFKKIRNYCNQHNIELKDVLIKLTNGEISVPHTDRIIANFKESSERLTSLASLDADGLRDELFPVYVQWSVPFRELLLNIDSTTTPNDILNTIRTNIIQPEMPTKADFVRIMSLHKSKGLTAQIVIITGFIESLIPKRNRKLTADQQRNSIEEQRRLVYVGLTRAKQELIISSIYQLPKGIALKMGANVIEGIGGARTITSSFVTELGSNFPETITGQDFLNSLS